MKDKFDVAGHQLVPKHEKLSDKAKQDLLAKYNITLIDLPRIYKNDPAIAHLDVKAGDVIRVTRKSLTAGTTFYFRGVTNV